MSLLLLTGLRRGAVRLKERELEIEEMEGLWSFDWVLLISAVTALSSTIWRFKSESEEWAGLEVLETEELVPLSWKYDLLVLGDSISASTIYTGGGW